MSIIYGWNFPAEFGFTGSAKGRHDARNHPMGDDGEYGDGSYVERAKGGRARKKMATGGSAAPGPDAADAGPMPGPTPQPRAPVAVPLQAAAMAAKGAMQLGRMQGARQAQAALANAARRPPGPMAGGMPGAATAIPAAPPPPVAQQRVPALKDGGHFIQDMGMKKGALHREMGIPAGEKIPAGRLAKAAHSDNLLLARRARTAEMLRGLPHGKKG